jgi:hypothetical protein
LKVKSFFWLNYPSNSTASERETAKELVLKNETSTSGEVFVEGS